MRLRLDRATLARSDPQALRRLALYVGFKPPHCQCAMCSYMLVEALVRWLDRI